MSVSWRTTRAVVILLAATTLVAGCGVSKAKYLEATQSAESLAAKNAELQKNLDASNAKGQELEQKVASMQSSVDQLNADLEREKQEKQKMQSTYDGLVGQLQAEVSSGHVQIQQVRDGIRVNLAQDILFKSGSANLDKAGKELLTKVADEMKTSTYEVLVIGHADNQKIGPTLAQRYPTNWELGGARSATIVRLFQDNGIATNRMLVVSASDARPRADNATPEGREQNRRIEILLRPVKVEEAASN